jgi:hypothetical protein
MSLSVYYTPKECILEPNIWGMGIIHLFLKKRMEQKADNKKKEANLFITSMLNQK